MRREGQLARGWSHGGAAGQSVSMWCARHRLLVSTRTPSCLRPCSRGRGDGALGGCRCQGGARLLGGGVTEDQEGARLGGELGHEGLEKKGDGTRAAALRSARVEALQ
jgi:hypothetical protein